MIDVAATTKAPHEAGFDAYCVGYGEFKMAAWCTS